MATTISITVILLYYVLLLVVAHFTSRNAKSGTFFNGDHNSPWYLVAFGTIGATISGVTFISVPGEVGEKQWHYLQFLLGNFVGYWIIAFVLIPLYYRLKLVSIYDYLRRRFGSMSHRTGALFFMLSQMTGASLRLYLVIGVLQILVFDTLGVPFAATAAMALIMIWLYIRKAGIKTVVWTDTLQTLCIIVSVVLTIVAITDAIGADMGSIVPMIAGHDTCSIFDLDWRSPTNFVKQFAAGIGFVIVMNGLDQNIMQKSLTCRNRAEAQKNLCWFSFAFIIANLLFMSLGTMLYIYADNIGMALPKATDDLFPTIVSQYLPMSIGIVFLLGIIASAFSSADSSLTALTTVWCIDILRLKTSGTQTARKRKRVTVAMALVMFGVVCLFRLINDSSIVSAIFTITGYTYGPLLGLFAFGISTHRTTHEKAVPAICIASPIICAILSNTVQYLFDGYQMGFELLLLNGALTYIGLWIFSKSAPKQKT